jgi:hypothetical protein
MSITRARCAAPVDEEILASAAIANRNVHDRYYRYHRHRCATTAVATIAAVTTVTPVAITPAPAHAESTKTPAAVAKAVAEPVKTSPTPLRIRRINHSQWCCADDSCCNESRQHFLHGNRLSFLLGAQQYAETSTER